MNGFCVGSIGGVRDGSGVSRWWRPSGASFGFCLRLSSATGEIVHGYERGTAGGMTFGSGLSGLSGMVRDCRGWFGIVGMVAPFGRSF